ncbi:calcium homeostasis modulator protein 2 isoform X2 [Monodon monoceros]|uniref:Calcium homeostasis modulator protein 2 isoform X2 n=1 Tax=Delphinapterus leucas TaxID=9749 RepID=A0A2Y9MRH8_DELLE|nr:calcium homeostasis modulator protein 2 isoform X2 [Delphinapterus leucas]XP_029100782.1 calcium homeostasis modulator protein 2 isoform X2 [Monodon monoceros]
MAALIAENFRFLSLFFKSKDVMIFNGLVALGTVGSQELFSVVAFHCPCSPARNYLYGLTAIGVPALVLFLIGVILNNHTWNLVAECQYRRTKNCSAAPNFLLLSSIVGRAAVAPITWSVISLLRGEAYVCALSEFVDPSSLTAGEDSFPLAQATEILATFPCREGPARLSGFREEVSRRLKYESQDSRTSKSIKALRPASSAQGSYREPEKLCSSPKAPQHVDLRPSLTASTKGHEVLAELRLRECPETLRSRRATRFPDPADPH